MRSAFERERLRAIPHFSVFLSPSAFANTAAAIPK